MQELVKAIQDKISPCGSDSVDNLHSAGKQWALFALDTYTDAFLTKALAISKAIAEFTNVMNKDNPRE